MTLLKINDFDPNFKQHFDNIDIVGYDVYSGQEKIGAITDILVEESGNLRYLVIKTGVWVVGKKVLIPIGMAKFNPKSRRVDVTNLNKIQVESLPNYNEADVLDFHYEEKVRNVYRASKLSSLPADFVPPAVAATNPSNVVATTASANLEANSEKDAYNRNSDLYALNDTDHQNLKLYEERLIADKVRRKAGEVTLGKRVDTETATVSVSLEKEKVVVERTTPRDATAVANLDAGAFEEGEIARMEVYEETVDIRKEAFVHEEVDVKKIVEKETATGEEQLRRERLEITSEGKTVVRDDKDSAKKV